MVSIMIEDAIRLLLSNLPSLLFVVALIAASTIGRSTPWPERYLSWILLLPIGVGGIWAGLFHIAFPAVASAEIGWQPGPFEFEVGAADVAMGIVAVLSFWRSYAFKAAIALVTVIFFAGVTVGHFIQAFGSGDYAPDNFGLLLVVTILQALALAALLWLAPRHQPRLAG